MSAKTNFIVVILALGFVVSQADEPPVPPGFVPPPAGTVQPTPVAPAVQATQPVAPPAILPSLIQPPPPAAVTNNAAGKIQFDNAVYEFGRVRAGDPIKHTFYFTNVGEQVLELTTVRPSCGCTTAGDWTKKAEPGQTGSIPVQVNSANFNGAVVKMVTVTCSDKQQPTVTLQLKGTIYKPIELAPAYSVVSISPDATAASTVVKIINNLEEPLTLSIPECNNHSFKAELVTKKEGKEFELTISAVPPLPTGNVAGQVTMKTSSTSTPILTVPFMSTVQQPISVLPAHVMLQPGPLSKPTPVVVTLQNNSTNRLTLTEPAVSLPGVDVKLAETQPGRFTATLSFPEGFQAQPGQNASFTIKTSNPRQPLIQIPITHMMRPAMAPAIARPPAGSPPPHPASVPVPGVSAPVVAAPANSALPLAPTAPALVPVSSGPPGAPTAQ